MYGHTRRCTTAAQQYAAEAEDGGQSHMAESTPLGGMHQEDGASQPTDAALEPTLLDDDGVVDDAEADVVDAADMVQPAADSTPPPRRELLALPNVPEVSAEDREFMQRVFVQVRDVDFRAPPPPPPKRDLAGPDKKIASLRQTIHELERNLARVGYVWQALQQRYDSVEGIVAGKEAECAAAVERYQQIKELSSQAATRDHAAIESLKKQVSELMVAGSLSQRDLANLRAESERTIADLTARLQKSEQEKAALLNEFRTKMESAQQVFTQLRDQSARAVSEIEARAKAREEELSHKLSERDATLSSFASEMANIRTQQEGYVTDVKEQLRAREQELEAARSELKSARAEWTQLGEQHDRRKQEMDRLGIEVDAKRRELEQAKAGLEAAQRQLDEGKATLAAAQDEARIARTDAEGLKAKPTALESGGSGGASGSPPATPAPA
jgi:predicted  nucleic acid-binding Zn-ribbon protein